MSTIRIPKPINDQGPTLQLCKQGLYWGRMLYFHIYTAYVADRLSSCPAESHGKDIIN